MTRFAQVLARVRDRLTIPEPERTRILLEMAADLDDSYRHHLARGCDEAEAVRRAEEAFATSDEALRLLESVHRPGLGRAAHSLAGQLASVWAKLLLFVLLGFEGLLAAQVLSNRAFFVHPSPFLWPLAGIAAAVVLFTLWKLGQLLRRATVDLARLRTGLGVPLFLAAAGLGVALLGFLYHLHRYFRLNAAGAPEALFINFAGWMISISSLMTVGLLTAILGGVVWLALSHLVARSERREIKSLIANAA